MCNTEKECLAVISTEEVDDVQLSKTEILHKVSTREQFTKVTSIC